MLKVGQQLLNESNMQAYKILRWIGSGSFGSVYVAQTLQSSQKWEYCFIFSFKIKYNLKKKNLIKFCAKSCQMWFGSKWNKHN